MLTWDYSLWDPKVGWPLELQMKRKASHLDLPTAWTLMNGALLEPCILPIAPHAIKEGTITSRFYYTNLS